MLPSKPVKKFFGRLLLVACVFSSTGCGIKLLYNNAERLTRWWVSDYIDMTPAQREFLDASSAEILYWHRTTQLTLYREQLLLLANAIGEPMDRAELQTYVERVEAWGVSIRQNNGGSSNESWLNRTESMRKKRSGQRQNDLLRMRATT